MKNFKTVDASRISISELMLPSHSNFSVTASVDTVDFLKPIEVGELVTMKASVNFVGKTSMVVGIRVEAENIRTGDIKHCNSSYFTMVAKDDKGQSKEVSGLILNDKTEVKRFLKALKRIETKKQRQKEFDSEDFSHIDYLPILKNYKVKIDLPNNYS